MTSRCPTCGVPSMHEPENWRDGVVSEPVRDVKIGDVEGRRAVTLVFGSGKYPTGGSASWPLAADGMLLIDKDRP